MKKIKYLIIVLVTLFCKQADAQLPFGDSAWVLQTALSDEFDTTAVRTHKWYTNWWGGGQIFNGAEINYASNITLNGSTLKIKADTLETNYYEPDTNKLVPSYHYPGQGLTFAYQGGVIFSKTESYKFGYFEYYAKFPSKYYSSWPGPWLIGISDGNYYNELDIAENNGEQTFFGNVVGNNYHVSNVSSSSSAVWNGSNGAVVLPAGDSLSGGFHKFALQWDKERVTWYFDDMPTFELYDPTGTKIPQNNTSVIINYCVDPAFAFLPADWKSSINWRPSSPTKWPQYLELDYSRYYKLQTDCNTDAVLCTPAGYDRKVKKSISTNVSCTPTYSPTTQAASYHLRATDYILINEGTTIDPSGTGYFEAEVMPCPQ